MKSVCIIPARGGSKRIPKKNIKLFAGKPIIAHSIETAKKSGLFDLIYVSTDDAEIASIAIRYGAMIIDRPASLSDDYTGTHDVIKHAVQSLIDLDFSFDLVCCLYATSPFIQIGDLDRGRTKILENNWKSVVAVTDFSFPIFRSIRLLSNGGVEMLFPEHYKSRSQDLETMYHDAGQFYWMKKEICLGPAIGFSENTSVVQIPHWRVQDIDNIEDWRRAEIIFELLKSRVE
jgi:N-acylneuraminate cytidylyltransferase